MVLGIGIGLIPPILLFNFVLYLTGASLAAWALNRNIDSQNELAQNEIGKSVNACSFGYFPAKFMDLLTVTCSMKWCPAPCLCLKVVSFPGFRHRWLRDDIVLANGNNILYGGFGVGDDGCPSHLYVKGWKPCSSDCFILDCLGPWSHILGVSDLMLWKLLNYLCTWPYILYGSYWIPGSMTRLSASVHVLRFAVKEVEVSGGLRPGRLVRAFAWNRFFGSNYQAIILYFIC